MTEEKKRKKKIVDKSKIKTAGTYGSAPGQFTFPWRVAFNRNNHQLVVSDSNDRLQFFDEEMKSLRLMGDTGNKPGQFERPNGLCYQPITDNLLVCDWYNYRLQMINSEDKVVAVIGTTGKMSNKDGYFNCPSGVACAPNGHFFVADKINSRVQLFDASGRFLGKSPRNGLHEECVFHLDDVCVLDRRFAHSSSMLLVANGFNNRMSVWSIDGKQHICNVDFRSSIACVSVNLEGFVYVSTSDSNIQVLDPRKNFKRLEIIGSHGSSKGYFSCPTGLCFDDKNTLMVADSYNHRIQYFYF